MTPDENNTQESVTKTKTIENEWMIRPCKIYENEYSDCTSIRARFHQYFIFGKMIDCTPWKHDCDNCYKWKETNNNKAAKEIIENEKLRRKARLGPHYANDVWEKRKTPPENWNTPLPKAMQEEYEHSYLYLKARELRGEIEPSVDAPSFCVVM